MLQGAGESYDFAFRLAHNAVKWEEKPHGLAPILIVESNIPEENNITGCWKDPVDNDIVYFRQQKNTVVGIYDFGEMKKIGCYIGKIENKIFTYKWQWYNGYHRGHGMMTLLENNKKLYGKWWHDNDASDLNHVGYEYINENLPTWLRERDFEILWGIAVLEYGTI